VRDNDTLHVGCELYEQQIAEGKHSITNLAQQVGELRSQIDAQQAAPAAESAPTSVPDWTTDERSAPLSCAAR
jgi:hypothetical protein